MGKKHSIAKPAAGGRKNGIFKIAGANFKDKKEIRWANYGEIEQTVRHTELVQDWVQ